MKCGIRRDPERANCTRNSWMSVERRAGDVRGRGGGVENDGRARAERARRRAACFVDADVWIFVSRGHVRAPFVEVMKKLIALTNAERDERALFTVSLDIPSGWSVGRRARRSGVFVPNLLISLTAPKCCATFDDPALGEPTPRMKRVWRRRTSSPGRFDGERCAKNTVYAPFGSGLATSVEESGAFRFVAKSIGPSLLLFYTNCDAFVYTAKELTMRSSTAFSERHLLARRWRTGEQSPRVISSDFSTVYLRSASTSNTA